VRDERDSRHQCTAPEIGFGFAGQAAEAEEATSTAAIVFDIRERGAQELTTASTEMGG
jgi:hypothetical protein